MYKNGKKNGFIQGRGRYTQKGGIIEGEFKNNKKNGLCKIKFMHSSLIDLEREGTFVNNLLFDGTVKGFNREMKDVMITYKNGIGQGTMSNFKWKSYVGEFIQIGEDDVPHGEAKLTLANGNLQETIFNRGNMELYLKEI